MSGERSIRDRLAEAQYLTIWPRGSQETPWAAADERYRDECYLEADALLLALPSVGLTLTRNDGG